MGRWITGLCWVLFVTVAAAAQENDLTAEDIVIQTEVDAFGLEQPFAVGVLRNQGGDAYQNITLFAEVYDADDNLIGEGLGYMVRACGEALINYALQPEHAEPFSIHLDIFEPDIEIDRVAVLAQGEAISPAEPAVIESGAISQVTDAEVVDVEWIDGTNLRYSTGCWRDVFINRPWFEYNRSTDSTEAIPHPRTDAITGQMRELLRLGDPVIFNRSFFNFAPGGRRAVYQTDLNTLATVEPDGSFARVVFDDLYNITLQGVNWHKDSGAFVAYYHGGYGDEVLYLVAHADGQAFSQHPKVAMPSQIVPGFAANGRGVVIGTTVDGVTGYYLKATTNDFTIPMFEAELPGNNWPAPFYEITAAGDRWIYIARPVDGEARLQCYNPDSLQLHDYTALPLDLETDERGWMWLSPDNQTLALAANGVNGGLWLIDLTQFAPCS